MILRVISQFGQPCAVACDACCEKAWGVSRRPTVLVDERSGERVFRSDRELPLAPKHPGTVVGGEPKPRGPAERLNQWCAQECERSIMLREGDDVTSLPDFSSRLRARPRDVDPHSSGE